MEEIKTPHTNMLLPSSENRRVVFSINSIYQSCFSSKILTILSVPGSDLCQTALDTSLIYFFPFARNPNTLFHKR